MRSAAIVVVLSLFGDAARGDDWPQWLGPQRDGVWRETGIVEKFPEGGPPVRWRAKIAAGYTGPAVVQGKVFVMDRVLAEGAKNHEEPFPQRPRQGIPGSERVLCFSEADGQPLWEHAYDCPYTVSYPLGPRATPTVHEGKVYTLGAEGHLFCLEADSGKPVWSHSLKKEYRVKSPIWGFAAHPLVDGNKLICIVGGEGSTVVAFDKDSGKEIWQALTAIEPGYCPPMIYEAGGVRQLIIWHGESVNGLNSETGEVYWTEPAPTYQGMSISTPRRSGDSLFVSAYPDTSLMLKLDPDRPKATVAWRGDKKTGLYCTFSTPFFEEGHLYGIQSGGFLTCVKSDTGERLWQTMDPVGIRPAGSVECFLVKNGDRYFVFTEKGDLIIARLSPKGYEEISRAHLLDPTSTGFGRDVLWSHPAFANRNVYVRNDRELISVSLAAEKTGK
jgi:outer membrane protein assembly factor BamB